MRDPKAASPATEGGIKAYMSTYAEKGISRYGIPQMLLFIDQLVKTSVGKINKKELRERYGSAG